MKRLALVVLAVLASSCASSSVPFKLPPIIVTLPVDSPAAPKPAVQPVEQATLTIVITDEAGAPIANMPVSLHTGELDDTNADGFVAWLELVRGPRHVVIHAGTTGFDSVEFDAKVDQAENTERVTLKRTIISAPLASLNIVVHNAVTGAGVPRATCTLGDESRSADGSGFINFPVRGSSAVRCAAGGYEARPPIELPPGDHRVPLVPIAPPAPPPPAPKPAPTPTDPGAPIEACNARNNTGRISDGCLEAVTHGNLDYMSCANGDAVACHRYVRRVAAALRTGDEGWGLITKFQGQGCTLTRCSQGLIPGEQKYGEDMVAYLPKGNPTNLWTGIDVIVGAGAPGARYSGGVLPPAVGGRPDNLWAPIP